MSDFIFYFKIGLYHVLDFQAYDHILFLIVLSVIYNKNQLKEVLWLITLFTIGHTLTLLLSAYNYISINEQLIEFLIPVTIFITGLVNVFTAKKSSLEKKSLNLFFALFFGLIHGLGFSNYFKMILGKKEEKLLPLLEFAIGVEAAQVIIVIFILLLGILLTTVFNVNRRDWILVSSSIVIGFSLHMIFNRVFW